VPLEEPSWWYGGERDAWRVQALRPASHLVAWAAMRRFQRATPYRSRLPVICVGNFTAGGTGKTPLCLLVARLLKHSGHTPVFLSRGYSGRQKGPVWVNPRVDTAEEIGDEPLLLARFAPTLVSRDRAAGARVIEAEKTASHIVMDDGLQNPSLVKSLSFAVVDGFRGLGNGEVIPAGPLRAPLEFQFELTDAIVVVGGSGERALSQLRSAFPGPVLSASVVPEAEDEAFTGAKVVAYAGIGNPERFLASLNEVGASVIAKRWYKDHHAYTEAEASELIGLASACGAQLVSTEKDLVRLSGADGPLKELARLTKPLRISLSIEPRDLARLEALIDQAA
jgi:tetraacyldisaccharide 4'-kinase